jgi:hypothetical protein
MCSTRDHRSLHVALLNDSHTRMASRCACGSVTQTRHRCPARLDCRTACSTILLFDKTAFETMHAPARARLRIPGMQLERVYTPWKLPWAPSKRCCQLAQALPRAPAGLRAGVCIGDSADWSCLQIIFAQGIGSYRVAVATILALLCWVGVATAAAAGKFTTVSIAKLASRSDSEVRFSAQRSRSGC